MNQTKERFISWNVRGLSLPKLERAIELKADVLLIQESHLCDRNQQRTKKILHRLQQASYGAVYSNHLGNSAGVFTMFNSNKFELIKVQAAIEGYYIHTLLFHKHRNQYFSIGNIYAPCSNDFNRIEFLNEIVEINIDIMHQPTDQYRMIGGDWNFFTSKEEHWKNYEPNTRLNGVFSSLLTACNLNKVEVNGYTWNNKITLDRFVLDDVLFTNCQQSDIEPTTSDHTLVITSIVLRDESNHQTREQVGETTVFHLSSEYINTCTEEVNTIVQEEYTQVQSITEPMEKLRKLLEYSKLKLIGAQKRYYKKKSITKSKIKRLRNKLASYARVRKIAPKSIHNKLHELLKEMSNIRRRNYTNYRDSGASFQKKISNYKKKLNKTNTTNYNLDYEKAVDFYSKLYDTNEEEEGDVSKFTELEEIDKQELSKDFTHEEIFDIIHECRDNSAAGMDGLSFVFFKRVHIMPQLVTDAINSIWNGLESFTKEDNLAYIVLLYKKGDRTDPANYRPISITSALTRIMSKAVAKRLQKCMDQLISCNQTGFIKKRDIRSNQLLIGETIKQILEMKEIVDEETLHKLEKILNLVSLDFQKAYDSVFRDTILSILKAANMPSELINFVKATFNNTISIIKIRKGVYSRPFRTKKGVKQGDPLSPLLFNFCTQLINLMICEIMKTTEMGIMTPNGRLPLSMYADDTTLFTNFEHTKAIFDLLEKEVGLTLNLNKCYQLLARNNSITVANDIMILGCKWTINGIDYKATCDKLIGEIAKAISILERCYSARDSIITRANACISFVIPILTYYSNFILFRKKEASKIDAMIRKYINVSNIKHCVFYMAKKKGGLGIRKTQHRNCATLAHWIIRAYSGREPFNFAIKNYIEEKKETKIKDVKNPIVRNLLIAWKHLNLGPINDVVLKNWGIKEICDNTTCGKLNVSKYEDMKITECFVKSLRQTPSVDTGKIINRPEYYYKYLHKMNCRSRVKQLRWRAWLNNNYVPIKRKQGERVPCTYCQVKIDYQHMISKCKATKPIKMKFVNMAANLSNITRTRWYNIWDNDTPPKQGAKANELEKAIDLYMSILKFQIWKQFSSFMFGNKPHVYINADRIILAANVELKRSYTDLEIDDTNVWNIIEKMNSLISIRLY